MRARVETLQLPFCLFSFPHKGYSYALKQSVTAKENDCHGSNFSGSGGVVGVGRVGRKK